MRAQQPTQNALKESSESVIALSNRLLSLREQISSHNSMTSPARISDLREAEKSLARKLEEAKAKMASAQMRVDALAPIPDEPFRPMAYGSTPVR